MRHEMAFNSIGFHAALVLNKLQNKRQLGNDQPANEPKRDSADTSEKYSNADEEYVTHRLNEIRRWERKLNKNTSRRV